jgi:hypothetical protein
VIHRRGVDDLAVLFHEASLRLRSSRPLCSEGKEAALLRQCNISESKWNAKQVSSAIMLLTCIPKALISNPNQQTGYLARGLLRFSSTSTNSRGNHGNNGVTEVSVGCLTND